MKENVNVWREQFGPDPSFRFFVIPTAINAKVNDADPRRVEEAADMLRQLKQPDSIAYRCGTPNPSVFHETHWNCCLLFFLFS